MPCSWNQFLASRKEKDQCFFAAEHVLIRVVARAVSLPPHRSIQAALAAAGPCQKLKPETSDVAANSLPCKLPGIARRF